MPTELSGTTAPSEVMAGVAAGESDASADLPSVSKALERPMTLAIDTSDPVDFVTVIQQSEYYSSTEQTR